MKLDKEIEQEYYKQAQGRQINVMDIPKLFGLVRVLVDTGSSVDYAVHTAIETYCKEAQ